MLLDPFEEQFHLPATPVERADGGCRKGKVVGEKRHYLARLGILESDTTQMFWIILAAGSAGQCYSLIADDSCAAL